jgi:hypothetical protein
MRFYTIQHKFYCGIDLHVGECPRIVSTAVNGFICNLQGTFDASVIFTMAALFKRLAEVGQHPQRQPVDTQGRLHPGHRPRPAGGAQRIRAGVHAAKPGADVQLTPAQGKRGEKTPRSQRLIVWGTSEPLVSGLQGHTDRNIPDQAQVRQSLD